MVYLPTYLTFTIFYQIYGWYGKGHVYRSLTFDDISIRQVMTDRFCVAAAQTQRGLQLSQTTKDATKALQDPGGGKQRAVTKNVGCWFVYNIWDGVAKMSPVAN